MNKKLAKRDAIRARKEGLGVVVDADGEQHIGVLPVSASQEIPADAEVIEGEPLEGIEVEDDEIENVDLDAETTEAPEAEEETTELEAETVDLPEDADDLEGVEDEATAPASKRRGLFGLGDK